MKKIIFSMFLMVILTVTSSACCDTAMTQYQSILESGWLHFVQETKINSDVQELIYENFRFIVYRETIVSQTDEETGYRYRFIIEHNLAREADSRADDPEIVLNEQGDVIECNCYLFDPDTFTLINEYYHLQVKVCKERERWERIWGCECELWSVKQNAEFCAKHKYTPYVIWSRDQTEGILYEYPGEHCLDADNCYADLLDVISSVMHVPRNVVVNMPFGAKYYTAPDGTPYYQFCFYTRDPNGQLERVYHSIFNAETGEGVISDLTGYGSNAHYSGYIAGDKIFVR